MSLRTANYDFIPQRMLPLMKMEAPHFSPEDLQRINRKLAISQELMKDITIDEVSVL